MHFLRLMNCSKKGSSRILSLQTEHNFEDTLIGYANLNTDELIDVKPKIEKQIKELKKINIDTEQKIHIIRNNKKHIQNTIQ